MITKALNAINNASYSEYFKEMDSLVPENHRKEYDALMGQFISGRYPWNFYDILIKFAKKIKAESK
jgi:hypothetical protein